MKTYQEFITEDAFNEKVKISKAVKTLIADINYLYDIDLTDYITVGNKRNFFVFDISELDQNQINNIERFANDKGLRHESAGYKKYAIYLK
ncbi:internal head protein [Salmonella phage KM16]|uniref:internal head protein n=1 Tax=Salmonella phage KM16 TaxID=2797303 RepID=UPI0024915BFD|nr:internal head protein [Salmonella phage KM16]